MSLVVRGEVDPAGAACLNDLIAGGMIASAHYDEVTESTNSNAINDLKSLDWSIAIEDHYPKIYLTDQQVAGRGRHGRTWVSPPGTLTFSLVIPRCEEQEKSLPASLLSLAVGVSIAQAIEHLYAPLNARLKWPNDVYIDGGKVAGVLLETTQAKPNLVVIGIGVNVNTVPQLEGSSTSANTQDGQATKNLPSQQAVPKSIANSVGRNVDLFSLMETIVERLIDLQAAKPQDITNEFQHRCLLTGNEIRFQSGNQVQSGKCIGVNETGSLVIQRNGSNEELCAGEVHLVRVSNIRQ